MINSDSDRWQGECRFPIVSTIIVGVVLVGDGIMITDRNHSS